MTSSHHRLALFAIFACAPTIAFAQADRIVGEPASTSLLVEPTDGIVHRPIQGNLIPARFSASGDAGATNQSENIVAYDEEPIEFFFSGREANEIANAFIVPFNTRLSSVYFAGVFNNELDDSIPNDAPRDYRVIIRARGADGLPGQELFSMEVQEPVNGRHVTDYIEGTYEPVKIGLPAEDSVLSNLPENIYIGIGNAGSDQNHVGLAFAHRRSTIAHVYPSYWYDTSATWQAFTNLRIGVSWESFVHPIRARFIIPVSTVDPDELPTAVDSQQNYPNPFNPTTSIGWSLAAASPVRLSVHNVLGQRVATLVDGIQPAGTYETRLDASGWASGVYVYVLETGTQTLTRRMVVLK